MSAAKSIYRIIRSVIFTTLVVVIVIFAATYVSLSIPAVQNAVKLRAETELSSFLGGKVEISEMVVKPFNELELYGVSIFDPQSRRCISVGKIAAGINFWPLLYDQTIEIAYGEIISLNANISQAVKDGPLNIDFIINAFGNKEKKEKSNVKVKLRNVVIRKSSISFDRLYIPESDDVQKIDYNHIRLDDFRADVSIPIIASEEYSIDLRRLAFREKSGFNIRNIAFLAYLTPEELTLSNFRIRTESSKISISDQKLPVRGFDHIKDALINDHVAVRLDANPLVLSDFSPFFIPLENFGQTLTLALDAEGNAQSPVINLFNLKNSDNTLSVEFAGSLKNILESKKLKASLDHFGAKVHSSIISDVLHALNLENPVISRIVQTPGIIELNCDGIVDMGVRKALANLALNSAIGEIKAESSLNWNNDNYDLSGISVDVQNVDLGQILDSKSLGLVSCNLNGDLSIVKSVVNGDIIVDIPFVDFYSHRYENISIHTLKNDKQVSTQVSIDDSGISLAADADCFIDGILSKWNLDLNLDFVNFSTLNLIPSLAGNVLSGSVNAELSGNSIDNILGQVALQNFNLKGKKNLVFNQIDFSFSQADSFRHYDVSSDFLDISLSGEFIPSKVIAAVKSMIVRSVPILGNPIDFPECSGQYADLEIELRPDKNFFATFSPSFRPAVPVKIISDFNGDRESLNLGLVAPYFIQGKNKLIKNTQLRASLSNGAPLKVDVGTVFPVKNNYIKLGLDLSTLKNEAQVLLNWQMQNNDANRGEISMDGNIGRDALTNALEINVDLNPSSFAMSDAIWKISPATLAYEAKSLDVRGLHIQSGLQFIDINGRASDNPLDRLNLELAGIDLEYIFDILNINHVDFGGIATGKAHVSNLFTKNPEARTDGLFVKNLAYNDCVFGDGQLEGLWDNEEKLVRINADIKADNGSEATVRGGVYVTRDSLSFDFGAKRVDVAFLKPFVDGFTSEISGIASGHVKMYGTFADIDLVGNARADSVSLLVDQTNVSYTAVGDTVFFSQGLISFPDFKLQDKFGNTCHVEGRVTHDFLRDAGFSFNVTQIDNMMVYDTGPSADSFWYGRVFAQGEASIRGVPGYVGINLNLATARNSQFTLVLDDNETAVNYSFLTFTDRRKPAIDQIDVREKFEAQLINSNDPVIEEEVPDIFNLDLLLDVTPDAKMIIVMDPKAGDKIMAEGRGALQMHYNSDTDKFNIYGKYSLLNGNYNFSLQELILKNFNIREGSSISFNGDPMRGVLDITAAYRVNTNLADLDQSFKSDPDLNRTSVPVDALLKVSGELDAPEINFDLDFPTVTSDVQRRVRSIVSTDDMMNQQIIYLLALNRFYSPEYTGGQQGGELASVASSTISSQIQNIIGSITDKFSLAPSFKSEKDNFSDMEVDVALSSRLFDNRLLLNGNLGYRDKSTSQTTFIGDFDLEYLLSRDGKLRLKAYNHFNDASYYLRSALTTQGIGIVYRKDFNDPFNFIKRAVRRRKAKNHEKNTTSSQQQNENSQY